MTTILSSRALASDLAAAQQAAAQGPVIVTDEGRPAWVLMRHEDYVRLTGRKLSIRDLLDHPASAHIDFDPPRIKEMPGPPIEFD